MTADTIMRLAIENGIPPSSVVIHDASFACPSPADIRKIGKSLNELIASVGLRWRAEQFDCNRYAKLASSMADIGWFNTRVQEDAIAFAPIGLASRSHAFNAAVHVSDKGRYYLAFYEPQPINGICLTKMTVKKEELKSCVSLLFV